MVMSLRSHSLVLRVAGGGDRGVLQARRQLGPHHQHCYLFMKAMKDFFTRRSTANSEPPPNQRSPLPRTPVSASGWVRASAPGSRDRHRDQLSGRLKGHMTPSTSNDGALVAHRFIDALHTLSEQLDSATSPAGGLPREATEDVHGAGRQSADNSARHLKKLEALELGEDCFYSLQKARRYLLRYYRLLKLEGGYGSSLNTAKEILAADDAGRRVYHWVRSGPFRELIESPSQTT
ncbi:hypothetical protein PG985_008146 [Apiospora marii]|uniref:Uncharacterized protein n=1 Tax=Apiospora marii TaxID=335849 RepID=A0ABR1R9P5_9PEZI